MNEFEVQVIDKDTGVERWLTVSAANKEEAKEKVAKLGEIVGEARLLVVASTADELKVTNHQRLKYQSDAHTALVMAILGFFFCGPVAIIGWFWVGNTRRKANIDFPGEDIGKTEYIICFLLRAFWLAVMIVLWISFAATIGEILEGE